MSDGIISQTARRKINGGGGKAAFRFEWFGHFISSSAILWEWVWGWLVSGGYRIGRLSGGGFGLV